MPLLEALIGKDVFTFTHHERAVEYYNTLVPESDHLSLEASRKTLKQRELSAVQDQHSLDTLTSRFTSLGDKKNAARLLAVSAPGSYAFLTAIPNANLDLQFTTDELVVAVRMRLGVPLFKEGVSCPTCRAHDVLDPLGHHAVTCNSENEPMVRHNIVQDAIYNEMRKVGWSVRKEVNNVFDNRPRMRPGDIFDDEKKIAYDVAVTSIYSVGLGDRPAWKQHAAAEAMAKFKHRKYDAHCDISRIKLQVLAFETFGGRAAETSEVIEKLAYASKDRLGVDEKTALRYINTRISVLIQRQNARAILTRNPLRYVGVDVSGLA